MGTALFKADGLGMRNWNFIGIITCCWFVGLPLMITSCASPAPAPPACTVQDESALIVEAYADPNAVDNSTKDKKGRALAEVLEVARHLPQHRTAIVILENYSEASVGTEFRDRATSWFIGLRGIGYQHIIFVKGHGVPDPNGLPVVAEYF